MDIAILCSTIARVPSLDDSSPHVYKPQYHVFPNDYCTILYHAQIILYNYLNKKINVLQFIYNHLHIVVLP